MMGAHLGFAVSVHMSADAKAWKKALLRTHGVTVIEYASDYSAAVTQGRAEAAADPTCHFVDDERSADLFLGYAVAAERLADQLAEQGVPVDAQHPLFVSLPCGVGGAPGGVAYGLKLMFGDAVHCLFAEPTAAPCMLLGLSSGLHDGICVQDIGLDGRTCADGLAVGRPSALVGRLMAPLLAGLYTVSDASMLRWVARLEQTEGLFVEPSAAASLPGMAWICGPQGAAYRAAHGLTPQIMAQATHIAWLTGGSLVPDDERRALLAQGAALLAETGT
jgi:D-serine dehydratase